MGDTDTEWSGTSRSHRQRLSTLSIYAAKYLAFYRRALLEGCAVIAVVTHDDASRTQVRTLLKAYGADAMTYFGQFSTEIWEG